MSTGFVLLESYRKLKYLKDGVIPDSGTKVRV